MRLRRLARRVARRLRQTGVTRFAVWHRRLDIPMEMPEPAVEVAFRFAEMRDLALLDGWVPHGALPELERRLDAGILCLLGLHGGRAVFRLWCGIRTMYPPLLNRVLDPGADFAYIFDVATVPELRGRHISPRGYWEVCRHARELGCTHVMAWIEVRNVSSQKSAARGGFVPGARITRVSLFGRHRYFVGQLSRPQMRAGS